jgi:hypothetical protein
MTEKLPGWVVDDATSVREEAAPYRDLAPAQRARHLAAVCRAGARLLRARSDAAIVRDYRDPLPASTVRALARLRGSRTTPRETST